VQLVIAGKAHPQDRIGKNLLYQWQRFIADNGMSERVMFVEDYDLGVAEQLVQGVDVWVNTPRRPWEASGTSGMKVLVNGGLNLSELDGWWAEAYDEELGWAVGDVQEHADSAAWDAQEAEQLYRLLEEVVVPAFYQRNEQGVPLDWVARMRESMSRLTAQYSTNRMMREYTENYYLPLADGYRQRSADPEIAESLLSWHSRLKEHWKRLHFGNVTSREEGGEYCFEVQVYLDDVPAEAVTVELYAQSLTTDEPALRQTLERGGVLSGAANAFCYTGRVSADRSVTDYTPRIIPTHPLAQVPLESQFILWYR
jgi:starch phosphorylase